MKKLYFLIIVLTLTAVGLGLLQIHVSSRLASNSIEVKNLQANIDTLKEKNQILNSKVLELTSFETLASRAAELGFVEAGNYLSLHKNAKLSLSQ